MKWLYIVGLFVSIFLEQCVAPGVDREHKEHIDYFSNVDELSDEQAQNREYFRYVLKVIKVVQDDPGFKKRTDNITDEEIKEGKFTEGLMSLLSSEVREKLNRLKKEEVQHQLDLISNDKKHMAGSERNEWNPIHQLDKDTFGQEDLTMLLGRYNQMAALLDAKRRQKFKEYEMKKELEHREVLKNGTEEERAEEERKYKLHHEKKHEKLHDPAHKAQMKEVWEQQDGLDSESFDFKTFFNLRDKNSDGYVDRFELETFFLRDLDKAYDLDDPDTDPKERDEEMERMREKAMKMDINNDGLISQVEFFKATEGEEFEEDDEWIPLTEKKQFTEEDLDYFREKLQEPGS